MRTAYTVLMLCAGLACTLPAAAQQYPARPVRMLVPFVAGGGTDLVARAVAQKLSERTGQQFVVDNRPGAGGRIAMETTKQAAPDGYTLTMISGSTTASSTMHKDLPYDMARDFAPISQVTQQPYVVLVANAVPVKSIPELIALAKAKPGVLNYGSSATGGMQHLAGTLLSQRAGISMVHVPYKGGGQVMVELAAGQVQLAFLNPLGARPHMTSGRIRGIAVTTLKRAEAFPNLPAIAETLPGFDVGNWYGLVAPLRTPQPVVQFLHQQVKAVVADPEVRARMEKEGSELVGNTPQEFGIHIQNEVRMWGKLIRETGLGGS
ncbi:MAG: tripartite tricarboxylate transporter substrate binding protein [Burkholderiales bacterium]|nr:tripartite tricarboxylate transporter substrate binding protein [Burkholderiales bacterium]